MTLYFEPSTNMGSIQTNIAVTEQTFMNNILQESKNDCVATDVANNNNNIVIVTNSIIGGDFIATESSVNTDASCVITSNIENNVSDILQAIIQQTNQSSNSLFGGFSFSGNTNVFDAKQTVTNNITQINEATCAANTTTSTNGNYVYVNNTSIFGTLIGSRNDSQSSASCALNNTMKNSVYNDAQASNNQSNQIQSMFVAIVAAIASIVGGIILLAFLLLGGGTVAVTEFSGGGGSSDDYPDDYRDDYHEELPRSHRDDFTRSYDDRSLPPSVTSPPTTYASPSTTSPAPPISSDASAIPSSAS